MVLNPLRAKMVLRLEQWPWSSFLATCGQTAKPNWLQTDFVLAQFAAQRARAIAKYVAFVHEGAKLPSVWEQLQGQVYLGSESFVKKNASLGRHKAFTNGDPPCATPSVKTCVNRLCWRTRA